MTRPRWSPFNVVTIKKYCFTSIVDPKRHIPSLTNHRNHPAVMTNKLLTSDLWHCFFYSNSLCFLTIHIAPMGQNKTSLIVAMLCISDILIIKILLITMLFVWTYWCNTGISESNSCLYFYSEKSNNANESLFCLKYFL